MKQFILLIVICLSVRSVVAQPATMPVHILRSILSQNAADTNRVKALLDLSRYYIFKPGELDHDLDTALLMTRQARFLSQSLHYLKGQGDADYNSYLIFLEKGDHPQAHRYTKEAIKLYSRLGYWQELGSLYENMTRFYSIEREELQKKIDCYQNALLAYQRAGNKAKQADIFKELADHHQIQENYTQALDELQRSLALYRQTNHADLERVYDLLGFVSTKLGDYKEGLTYGLLAVKSAEARKDSSIQLCTTYNRLGLTYFALRQYKQANTYFQKSIQVARYYRENAYVINLAGNIAKLWLQENKPQTAFRFFKQQIQQYPSSTAESKLIIAHRFMDIYAELNNFKLAQWNCDQVLDLLEKKGNGGIGAALIYESTIRFLIKSKQYRQAYFYLQRNEAQCKNNGSVTGLSQNNLLWFKLDSIQGRYHSAIQHYQRHMLLQDSLLNVTKSRQIAQLEVQYESEKKDRELKLKQQSIQLLTKQSQLQHNQLIQATILRNAIIAGTILLVLLLGLGFNQYQLKQRSNQLLEAKQIEINRKNGSLERLVLEKDHLLTDKEQLLIDKDHLLEEREWMLKEIHHRVKNNLQIITSLLHSQGSFLQSKEALAAIRDSQNRVYVMALIHQKLYLSDRLSTISMDEYIKDIVDYLITAFNQGDRVKKKITVTPVNLDVILAVPVGLILNEVVTNSLKFAFPSGRFGTLSVELHAEGNQMYRLIMGDDGIGFPTDWNPNNNRTLGMSLIRGLSEQIEGTLEISQKNGVQISLTFVEDIKHTG
ncbi:histidine kinase dimerization/phosphoacceptor domain -containing protein [Larkinella insperata]|uniref:histidine kinase n=1 Tax=Larkinella insperata TaxID=332158 RepID=A0ABW3QCQ2_9BACT